MMILKMKGFKKSIANMENRAKDFQGKGIGPYQEITEIVVQSISTNFNAEGRPKWRKRKGTYAHPPLKKTGEMKDRAETSAFNWNHLSTWHVLEIFSTFYGLIHQYCGVKTRYGSQIQHVIRKFVNFQKREVATMKKTFQNAFHRE